MGKAIVTLVALGLVSAAGVGCGKKTAKTVDCPKMCTRTFQQCVGEVLIARGKIDQAKLDKITKSGVIKKVRKVGYGTCLKACNKAKGAPSDAAQINKCMQLDDCKAFAKCMKDVE